MPCPETERLITSVGFLAAVASQAVAGFISAVICIFASRQCKDLYFHVNCKILIVALLVLYIVHSVFIASLQTVQLIRYYAISDPCQVGLPPVLCFCLRLPATVCMIAFATLQFAITIERAVALWKRREYERYGPQLGCALTFICIIPFYTMIAPIILWFIIKWSQQIKAAKLKQITQKTENERDIYFQSYSRMWNNVLSNKG
ncbi:hypothetical protein ANCCEY_04927 [Ancylostoma ceylanicum]|uniref:G-protein coupled receptors family 1 profile domain-containing protein n=1 Tax=Ancylostoma ceylanicum TaxID=53326 RepID=A0A0D6M0Z2_9BILA|nr:hypothetical protein ANCCEY_04927 [Ancylostoma ceylanicum]